MNKDLQMNLQLFADGEEPTVENTAPVEQPQGDSEPDQAPQGDQPQEQPDWAVDPDTGEVTFNPNMFDDTDEDSDAEPEEQAEEQPQPEQPQTFTVKVNGVDQQVTLDELRNGYMMHADYTRKSQALADERRRLEAQYGPRNPQQGQPVQPPQPQAQNQPPKVDPKEYYKTLSDYAIKRVQENLGEDFDEYNPVHQAALADEISTIKAQMYERNVGQQRLQAVYNKYSQDPNIAEIDRYAAQRLQQLPYQQAVQIQQALRNNDARVIDAYMGAVRDEYYRARGYIPVSEAQARQSQPVATPPKQVAKQKPPFAEPTGVQKNTPKTERKIDYSKLGKMTLEDQAKLVSQLGLG